MTRNQTKNRSETHNCSPEPCLALFSERAAAVVEWDGTTILQLNVEGLTKANLTISEQLVYTKKVTAMLQLSHMHQERATEM